MFFHSFILTYFPFDTQTCKIELKADNKEINLIYLKPDEFNFIGEKVLSKFYVKDS